MRKLIILLILSLVFILGITTYYQKPDVRRLDKYTTITTYYVGDEPIYSAQYLIITQTKKKLIVELVIGPGPENVIKMEDGEARFYLEGMGLIDPV
jgi:hypothetical protein